MATERYDKTIDPQEWQDYFRLYADIILPLVNGKVLDIGCGQGWLTKEIAGRPEVCCITAIDKFNEQPEVNKDPKIEYLCSDIPSISMVSLNPEYDTIVSTEFVEHIELGQFDPLLEKIGFWLKPGGLFLGSTPNKIVPTTNPYHLHEYTLDEFKEVCEKRGFKGEYFLPRQDLIVWKLQKLA